MINADRQGDRWFENGVTSVASYPVRRLGIGEASSQPFNHSGGMQGMCRTGGCHQSTVRFCGNVALTAACEKLEYDDGGCFLRPLPQRLEKWSETR
jgi:hypothetical protein